MDYCKVTPDAINKNNAFSVSAMDDLKSYLADEVYIVTPPY